MPVLNVGANTRQPVRNPVRGLVPAGSGVTPYGPDTGPKMSHVPVCNEPGAVEKVAQLALKQTERRGVHTEGYSPHQGKVRKVPEASPQGRARNSWRYRKKPVTPRT